MAATAYCTPEDLGRYGVNAKALEAIPLDDGQEGPIEAASAFMDAYLGKQFQLPLLSYGPDIKECCAVITAWRVLSVRGLKPGENPEDNLVFLNYREKLKWLELVASSKVTPVAQGSPSPFGGIVSPPAPAVGSAVPRWGGGICGDVPFGGRRR